MTLANQHGACKQWQASAECDDKSEFVVWQIRACGDKSASGAWQIQTTCESNTLCLSHLPVNKSTLGGLLQVNAAATMSLFVHLASSSLYNCKPEIYRDCNHVVQSFHTNCTLQLGSANISKYPGWENRNFGGVQYFEGGFLTAGLWHLYTVPVQFYSPHWN